MTDRKPFLAAAAAACLAAGAHAQPLVKNGACPTLERESAPWLDSPEARGRFITNNTRNLTLRANPGTMQKPLAPQASINCSQTHASFKAEMWASEATTPAIRNIQAFTFDERGRMWAVDTRDYPNAITAPFEGNDRILILEDVNGDRVVDKQTVFVSGLNIPQAIEIVPQGVVVGMAPHLVLFEDKDGNDVADSPAGKILYTGFKKGDTHGSVQGILRYGPDNWLYGGNGYNGGNINGVSFTSGVWRARTDGSKFEYLGQIEGANSAGFGMSEEGLIFGSAANEGGNRHIQHYVFGGFVSARAVSISAYGNDINAITEDMVQGDFQDAFTATTGPEIYTSRLFPQSFWNRASFNTEPTGHLVAVDYLSPNKSTWTANRVAEAANIFASRDAWTAPLFTRVGPDGALWVLDWYMYVLLHNGMPASAQGAGDAWPHPLRARTQERIYRIVPADGKTEPVLDLSGANYAQLVATFANPNLHWRTMAQKLILRKATTAAAKAEVEPLLEQALKSRNKDAVGLDGVALHALWTAEGLGLFAANPAKWNPILVGLLRHPSPGVRMNVAKAMPAAAASAAAIKDQCAVNDDDASVRLWTLLALSRMPATAGIQMFATYRNLDTWSQQAFTRAAAGAGVTEAAAKPCTPQLDQVSVSVGPKDAAVAGWALRFTAAPGGFAVVDDPALERGELTLHDLRGAVVDRVAFDGRAWPRALRASASSVHTYVFRAASGAVIRGRLVPAVR